MAEAARVIEARGADIVDDLLVAENPDSDRWIVNKPRTLIATFFRAM